MYGLIPVVPTGYEAKVGRKVGRRGEEEKIPICRINVSNNSWTESAYPTAVNQLK
jgi:hypothetical protein